MLRAAFDLAKHWSGRSRMSPIEQHLALYRIASAAANIVAWLPLSLTWLFRVFKCDKQQAGWHEYGPAYDGLFRPRKYRRIRLLEIGIGGDASTPGGKSLLAWRAYFPLAHIVAADIEDKSALTGRRLDIVRLDQSDPTALHALARDKGPFDLIIDDGSHYCAHQILSFEHLFGALRDDGLYVIEDVQTSFWPGLVGGTVWDGATIDDARFRETCQGYFLTLANYLNQAEFVYLNGKDEKLATLARSIRRIGFEHNLIIVWKGGNRGKSKMAALAGSMERA